MSEIYKVFDNSGLTALTDHMKTTRTKANSNEAAIETLGEDLVELSSEVVAALGNKQDKLTFDSTPTSGSANPVTSTGVKTYVDTNFAQKQMLVTISGNDASGYTLDKTCAEIRTAHANGKCVIAKKASNILPLSTCGSSTIIFTGATAETTRVCEVYGDDNIVYYSYDVVAALGNKQDKLTFDSTPTSGSLNPVTSGGVKTYVDNNFAAKTHEHSEYFKSYTETDPIVTGGVENDTPAFWVSKGSGYCWISELNQLVDQPSQYGFLISYVSDTDVFQTFRDQTSGITYFRSGDDVNAWFRNWTEVITADNMPATMESNTITLTTSGWSLSGDRYQQTVSVTGVTTDATQVIFVDCALGGTDLDADATVLEAWQLVSCNNVAQGSDSLTFYAYEAPTVNIPVNVGV